MIYSPDSWWLGEVEVYAIQDLYTRSGCRCCQWSSQSQSVTVSQQVATSLLFKWGHPAANTSSQLVEHLSSTPQRCSFVAFFKASKVIQKIHAMSTVLHCHACSNRLNTSQRFHFWEMIAKGLWLLQTTRSAMLRGFADPVDVDEMSSCLTRCDNDHKKGPKCRVLYPHHLATVKPANDNDSTFFKLLCNVFLTIIYNQNVLYSILFHSISLFHGLANDDNALLQHAAPGQSHAPALERLKVSAVFAKRRA